MRVVPDQRMLVVLGALVVGMTLASAVLLALEPGPSAPMSGIELLTSDPEARVDPAVRLFDTPEPRDWRRIVIHDTGALAGSAGSIGRDHERLGRQGLGYHFVINNGSQQPDGMIEMGFRWEGQLPGAYLEGEGAEVWHERAIGICLVGDGEQGAFTDDQIRELTWLVQHLQHRFGIPGRQVYVVGGSGSSPLARFPHARFRQQILTSPNR